MTAPHKRYVPPSTTYRVEISEVWSDKTYTRPYENNRRAAQSFARRETRKTNKVAYVIESVDGIDREQMFYSNGVGHGWERK